jgi:hypothetical protein
VVCYPIDDIDKELGIEYAKTLAAAVDAALEKKEKKKKGFCTGDEEERVPEEECVRERIRIEDATPESVQSILEHNDQGVFMKRDELSGWFGQMEKYGGGGRGASADRGFWLQSFNGGYFVFDRVKRGSGVIKNLSVSLLGGIQNEALRRIVEDGVDDGLLQRLFVIMLRPAVMGRDEPVENDEYDALVRKLYKLREREEWYFSSATTVKFTDEAAAIRCKLEQKHLDLQSAYQTVNRKLASHIGKYDGLFARLCLLWQIIENVDKCKAKGFDGCAWPYDIEAETAQRVADFMHHFLLKHAITFYVNELGLSDDHDRLSAVAGYILARRLNEITRRDVQRGDQRMRSLTERDTDGIFEQLEALGWLVRQQGRRFKDVQWLVNPAVHTKFKAKATEEAKRRESKQADLAAALHE